MNRVLAVIPARGGSKSIPKKNIIDLGGKPLMAWSIEAALSSKSITDVVVSSDDDSILEVAQSLGAITLKRPEELSGDRIQSEPVLIHVLKTVNESYDYLILLQATSPLRTAKDIDAAFEKFLNEKNDALISVYEPSHSPFKSFVINKEGTLEGIVNNEYPFMPRQTLPKTYYPNGAIYIVKVKKFLQTQKLFYENSTSFYEMSEALSIDIDNLSDLRQAEKLIDQF